MALVLVLGVAVVLVAMMFIATESGTAGARDTAGYQDGTRALGAATAVLSRHERDVMLLASVGDAANFADWATYFGKDNYGVDFVGDCEVRWRVEPARTAPVADPAGTATIPYLVNPSPDPTYSPPTGSAEQPNQTTYMYKVSAEARLLSGSTVVARAQGARFVAIAHQPLFRYVIFYAQRGPKGDLEFGHADSVDIKGNVHSNGSIYVGGGLKVNDMLAQRGTFDGALAPTQTRIGPDVTGQPVLVTGVDGLFRLSKPLMFSIVNGFPLTNTSLASAGAPVGDWTGDGSYDLTNTVFPLETTAPAGGTALAKTLGGRAINPYRLLSISGAVTQGPDAADSARLVNGTALRGTPSATANDARDHGRPSNRLWPVVAAADYGNRARTSANGGTVVSLSKSMSNRPFEAQALTYVDADGDATTDDHEYARPVFIDIPTGNATYDLPASGPALESPGAYLSMALGGQAGAAMLRRQGGTGWDVRTRTDLVNPTAEPDQGGLIVRERPVPDTDYWPGTTGADIVDPANPRWLPFAYGKQWYPTIDPFSTADVSDNLFRDRAWDAASPSVTSNISLAQGNRVATYATGGRLSVIAAANPGPSDAANGAWSGYNGTSAGGIQRKQYFYRDPWRFVHLGKMKPDTARNGLRLAYYQDSAYWDENKGQANALPFSGTQIAVTSPADAVVATAAGRPAWAGAPAIPSAGYWSARWMGFISPTASNSYLFSVSAASANDRVRVWVAGTRVAEANQPAGSLLGAVQMSTGRYYPVVIEFSRLVTGAPGAAPQLSWQPIGGASTTVPDTRLYPPTAAPGFARASFTAVQCRIDDPQAVAGPAGRKVGLMVRPDQGVSPVLQGGSAYAMVGWSPVRGFFTQRRREPATEDQRTLGLYYIGNGNSPSQAVDASGQVPDNPTTAGAGWNRTSDLLEVARGAVTLTTAYPTTITTTGAAWSTTPSAYAGPTSKDIGGGKIWTILDPFSVGPYIGSQTWTPGRRQQLTNNQTQTVRLDGAAASFTTADDGKTLYVFTTGTANGQLIGSANMGYRTNNRTWWFSDAAGTAKAAGFDPASALPDYLTRTWASGSTYGAYVYGAPVAVTNFQVGTSGTAWAGTIRINKNGTVSNATASDLALVTGLAITSVNNGAPSIPQPALTYPPNSATTPPAAPGAPSLPDMTNGGAGRTFAVQRSNSVLTFDLNPFITGSSVLPAATQTQYLPRGAGWPATWPVGLAWPATVGFRPDVWMTSAVAPGLASVPSTATSDLAGITGVTATGSVTGGTGSAMVDDLKPAGWSTAKEIWLRLENVGGTIVAKGFAGAVPPSGAGDPGWQTIGNALDVSAWGGTLLAGPCVQSGDINTPTSVTFTDLRVETTLPAPNDVIDAQDWDNSQGTTDDLTRYLISQYQVFFGTREITEDFFTWRDPATQARLADEQWFYNAREFWSQPRWWDHTNALGQRLEKDPFSSPQTTFTSTKYRELLAKTTVLSLDLKAVQAYLATRLMGDAVRDAVPGVGSSPAAVAAPGATLASRFNGLIYAVRTNRYPWNPNTNAALGAAATGLNPWSPLLSGTVSPMPNSLATATAEPAAIANGAADDGPSRSLDAWSHPDLVLGGVHKLQPYVLPQAPAFKPQRWHHGVRLVNGADISWNYPSGAAAGANAAGGTNWTHASPPDFGSCRLSVVTPDQLYVQGSLNVDSHQVMYRGNPTYKPTPLAIMGDQVTLLSNSWTDLANQQAGLTAANVSGAGSVGGTGTLSCATFGPAASSTSYQAGIVTNNIPTTQDRVREGQGAPFVDTVLFLENWNNRAMGYLGSLVVLDSRRTTQAFLHDSFKSYGTTPFGIAGSGASDPWLAFFGVGSPDWIGRSPAVFSEPVRTYAFNYDFLVPEGTPPFVPFGVTSNGAGGWVRITQ